MSKVRELIGDLAKDALKGNGEVNMGYFLGFKASRAGDVVELSDLRFDLLSCSSPIVLVKLP